MARYRHAIDYTFVTLITVLIWLYAEGRNVQAYQPPDRVPLTLKLDAPDLVVTDQSASTVGIEFLGATAEIDQLRPLLAKGGLTLTADLTEPGRRDLVLRDVLWRADPIDKVNVNVGWVDPPTLTLMVDHLAKVPVKVAFRPTDVKLVDGSLKIEPDTVTLSIPQTLAQQMGIDESFQLEAEPITPPKSLPPGVERTIDARLKVPQTLAANPHVKLDRTDVRLTFTIDKAEDTITLAGVPVWVLSPPSAEYAVKLADNSRVLQDVKVTGPGDMIQQVRAGSIRIIAVLRLNSDKLAAGVGKELTETVTFEAPKPLIVEATNATVHFTVSRNTMATAP